MYIYSITNVNYVIEKIGKYSFNEISLYSMTQEKINRSASLYGILN